MKSNDLQAKRHAMTSFFDDLDGKVAFLKQLVEQGRKDEARMLCVCYLDGLSNWLHQGSTALAKNFVTALSTLSGEVVFSLVVPENLLNSLPWGNAPGGAANRIKSALRALPAREAALPSDLITAVTPAITPLQLTWLKDEMWRGSVAMAVYMDVRSLNVHGLRSANGLLFRGSTFKGKPLPRIDFLMLHQALQNLAAHARSVSMSTNKWFGII
jgi:hypothetical protein